MKQILAAFFICGCMIFSCAACTEEEPATDAAQLQTDNTEPSSAYCYPTQEFPAAYAADYMTQDCLFLYNRYVRPIENSLLYMSFSEDDPLEPDCIDLSSIVAFSLGKIDTYDGSYLLNLPFQTLRTHVHLPLSDSALRSAFQDCRKKMTGLYRLEGSVYFRNDVRVVAFEKKGNLLTLYYAIKDNDDDVFYYRGYHLYKNQFGVLEIKLEENGNYCYLSNRFATGTCPPFSAEDAEPLFGQAFDSYSLIKGKGYTMDAEQYAYYRRYVHPLSYTGLLWQDFGPDSYPNMKLNQLLQDILGADGIVPYLTEHPEGLALFSMTAEQVYQTLRTYFPISRETLGKLLNDYPHTGDAYYFELGRDGPENYFQVVDVREQTDVLAIRYVLYQDTAFDDRDMFEKWMSIGELTVQDTGTGCQYLSNRIRHLSSGEDEE